MAAIDELEIGVKEIGIGRAGGFVGVRHGLRLVVEIGKLEAIGIGLLLETGGAVGRVRVHIIGADGDDAERLVVVIGAELAQRFFDVLDVGAVGADEEDEQRLLAAKVVAVDDLAGDGVGEREVGQRWCRARAWWIR